MDTRDIIKYVEEWAPPGAAWEKDNVGLQVGSYNQEVSKLLIALELNKDVAEEAFRQRCNLIITHHPFIFQPIKKLDFSKDPKNQLIRDLIKNDISVFSAHTNLDFTFGGVSFTLAKKLGLKNIRFLANEKDNQLKLVTFVPKEKVEELAEAIYKAGGGKIGEYTQCSYRSEGEGTFRGSENSSPVVGEKEKYERAKETRLEIVVDSWNLNKAITALKKAHPYEEPAYDIYPTKNENPNYGFGAIGELTKPLSEKEFLSLVSKTLEAEGVRYCVGKGEVIKRVAVCGGSGSDLLNDAIGANADAFVTSDIKYHSFQDAEGKIMFIDAGHYETEVVILDEIANRLKKYFESTNSNVEIVKFDGSTNPIRFFNN